MRHADQGRRPWWQRLLRWWGMRRSSGRMLTAGERRLAASMFGRAIDPDRVRLHHAKWVPFQLARFVMAPDGHIWFPPRSGAWREDFSIAEPALQRLFVHELTHVWQHQSGLNLLLRRHPFCRYAYALVPDRPLTRYGIEQQAMIVEHAFAARQLRQPDPALETLLAGAFSPAS